ncbi:MAG: DUF4277 domain-containing protein, partial [Candidatus Methanomethylophilaceae archaeon]|nr:DUF4277 domain-containing protein [Candidatus Methanomethylophilaceae archaeon]
MKARIRTWTPATLAITLTILRKEGLVETIDSRCKFDRNQRNLTPGEVALILIGATCLRNKRIPLYKIASVYEHMPLSGILGKQVDLEMLNDHALARGLDAIYPADREQLVWDISKRFEIDYGIVADVLHLDQTKVRTFVIDEPDEESDAAKPEFGIDKEGRTDFRLYSLNSITDNAGILRYSVPDDGNTTDAEMDLDAINFVLDNVEPSRTVVVTDSKGANAEIMEAADEGGLGIVAKVPVNFSSSIKDRIGLEMFNEGWGEMSDAKVGHWFHDVTAMTDGPVGEDGTRRPGRELRFVPFRSEKMMSDRRASMIRSDLKTAEKKAKELSKKVFGSDADAMLAVGSVQEELTSTAYRLKWTLESSEEAEKRGIRGRPPADYVPRTVVKWKVSCEPVVDEEWADILADRESLEVIVTNLPRPPDGCDGDHPDGPRYGCTPESVLRLYLGQYRQEHTFKLMKGHVGLNQVFFKTPERENVILFLISVATLLRNLVNHLFKRDRGIFTTFEDMVDRWMFTRVRVDGDELDLDGDSDQMFDVMRRLDISEREIVESLESNLRSGRRDRCPRTTRSIDGRSHRFLFGASK